MKQPDKSDKEKPYFTFVGPAVSAADLAQIIAEVQTHGIAAGIQKHFELSEKSEDSKDEPTGL